jgi:hypothetical protein
MANPVNLHELNPTLSIAEKVRHFYDIYYLLNDVECKSYFDSNDFVKEITELITHDRTAFDDPPGWGQKAISKSPLIRDFDSLWNNIKATYSRELADLAFSDIPDEKDVSISFKQIINKLSNNTNS